MSEGTAGGRGRGQRPAGGLQQSSFLNPADQPCELARGLPASRLQTNLGNVLEQASVVCKQTGPQEAASHPHPTLLPQPSPSHLLHTERGGAPTSW